MTGDALLVFLLRLAHMDVKRTLKLLVRLCKRAAELLVGKILGMNTDICRKVTARRRLGKVDALVEAAWNEGKPDPADVAAHTRRRKRISACASVLIHVCNTCRAPREHFHCAPRHSCGDVFVGHLRLDGEDCLFKPALKRKSAAHPAQERHRRVAMAVHEPRKNEARLVCRVWCRAQVNLGDCVALDLD